ncbi:MAG TPA: class I SAM-dependent methyltransferase [Gaiellaceae bacterium]|nr:class I SAM-dependent methyltransferase [Gaiellaceae bacterium]
MSAGQATAPPAPPAGPAAEVAALRAALDRAGFTNDAVRAALGAGMELQSQSFEIAVQDRRLGGVPDELAALVRLLVLDLPAPAAAVERALGDGAELLVRLGVAAERDGELRAAARIVPHDELLVASDRVAEDAPEHVAGVHWPSATLSHLTVRRQVGTALDVGTGNGIQALRLAAHAGRVVATDVNERALAFAEFNAALNGVGNVELRAGSFFEPVAGERFDLVVCNPPYVISPETEHVFRDSGLPGDTVSEQLVRDLPSFLADDAFATITISWIAGDDVAARPRAWLAGSGCDAWILHTAPEDPLRSAASWNRTLGGGPDEVGVKLDSWLEYYARLGIDAIAYGAVVLHRRAGDNWVRSIELTTGLRNPASAHLLRLFAAQELLAAARGDALLDRALVLVEDARLDRTEHLAGGAWLLTSADVRLAEGLGFGAKLDRYGVGVVTALDGSAPLRPRLPALAAELGVPEDDLAAFASQLVGQLVELGFAAESSSAR